MLTVTAGLSSYLSPRHTASSTQTIVGTSIHEFDDWRYGPGPPPPRPIMYAVNYPDNSGHATGDVHGHGRRRPVQPPPP